ncbi:MAG TPA: ATP-binding protein [Acidimicrobiia bacterium]|nr:ATP-binding protein [Acidimicrobiia bacterium]
MTLRVESNARAPRLSRSHLAEIRRSLEPRYDDVLLLVSELVTNSVRHSGSEEIDVKVSTIDGHIRVEVSDSGPGFDAADPRGDGLGIDIVQRLAERWGYTSGDRFTVWAELERTGT